MSSVVLNQQNGSGQLSANSALIGSGGIFCNEAGGSTITNLTATEAFTCAARFPEGPARTQACSWTTYCSDFAGGGVNINQLQKYAYADPLVAGPQTIQEYEQGYWAGTSTAFVAPAVAVDTIFVNRPAYQPVPLAYGATNKGTFTTTAAPVVVPAAGITANSQVRLMLVGGTAAAFTAAAAGGLVPPAITIQVGATTAASTFTAAATPAGWTYAWEILYA